MARLFHASRRTLFAAIAALVLLACTRDAVATVITVTTTTDELNTDGDCSLREAFVAANVNSTRDACPAGSSSQGDEIVLAAGASYSLTLPFTTPTANDGPLQVRNDTPTLDIKVTVSGAGSATISQDSAPDGRVLVVANGAHLDLEDVIISGGTAGGTDDGGGILVGTSAQLALLRCTFRDNVAADAGGAIRNQGTLIVEDSAFDHNVAANAGGAISSSSGTSVLIAGSFFAENEAHGQFSGGGAIDSPDKITIVDSSFVNNRAKTLGGAITHFDDAAGQSSISQSCFVGNAAGFTGNAIDVFAGSQPLGAAGLWWGAENGPSGTGNGDGDAIGTLVTFDPPSPEPFAACLPMELVSNGGFQSDGNPDGIPLQWAATAFTPSDGRACSDDGACILKLRGNAAVKRLTQTVLITGAAGDSLTFKARSRAKDVPALGAYRATATILHADGSKQKVTLDFSAGKHGFERLSQQVTAAESYEGITIAIEYGRSSGIVRFDSVSLLLNP